MTILPKMRAWAIFGLVLTAGGVEAKSPTDTIRDGITFGPQQHLSGVYFSNFENNKFFACDRNKGGCDQWASRNGEVVFCAPIVCADLENRITRGVRSHDRWALFRIDFLGRRSLLRSSKRYLGDTESKVYLEKIQTFDLIKTQ